jgi:hypothetical protein
MLSDCSTTARGIVCAGNATATTKATATSLIMFFLPRLGIIELQTSL